MLNTIAKYKLNEWQTELKKKKVITVFVFDAGNVAAWIAGFLPAKPSKGPESFPCTEY